MEKMWKGRFSRELDQLADEFNSSIKIDGRMYREDITGSMAHAAMLGKQGIIEPGEAAAIIEELGKILSDIDSGALQIDPRSEDIHMFVEAVLTERLGDAGKRLHTARSRNDQVAVDVRLYMRHEIESVIDLIKRLIKTVADRAEEHQETILPGYTHLQRAQPITFGQHLMAYAMMLLRDVSRFEDCAARMNESPLGSCALSGTTYPIDRHQTAGELGFSGPTRNSIDGVSDRDFAIEFASAASILMMHLSRFSEEVILWQSWEFGFIDLDDSFSTGSSIMPQKKNPDMAELVRGKTGRVYGDLTTLLVLMKGIPLAYNKDMQEDKEALFDCLDTVKLSLSVFEPMIATMRVKKDKMARAASEGFINATDCADYLVKKGMPFRTAYKIVGTLIARCIEDKTTLDELPLSVYREYSDVFESDVYEEIAMDRCVARRVSFGGTGPDSVRTQIAYVRSVL